MAFTQKPMTGALWRNKHKPADAPLGTGKPDYTGNVLIGGVKYELAGWVKEPKAGGAPFLSLTVKAPQGHQAKQPDATAGEPEPPKENVAF